MDKLTVHTNTRHTCHFVDYGYNQIDQSDADCINSVLQAAVAYVSAVRSDSTPDNWPVLFDILADAVEEL